jgi:hypothetical protein
MNGQSTPFYGALSLLLFDLCGLLQWISGVILIKSVFKIRRFFLEHHAAVSLNVKKITLHASAFIIYLAASIAYFGS